VGYYRQAEVDGGGALMAQNEWAVTTELIEKAKDLIEPVAWQRAIAVEKVEAASITDFALRYDRILNSYKNEFRERVPR